MRKFAIFGGTFNPVHKGHLLIAERALRQVTLDQVIWVTTRHPPHKEEALAAFSHRLEMVRSAIGDYPAFTISDLDVQPDHPSRGASYAIATFQTLQSAYPDATWFWIIGMDAFQTLPKWRSSAILATACTWLVAPRLSQTDMLDPEHLCQTVATQMAARSVALRWQCLQMSPVEISSSLVRQACRKGRSIDALVPEKVKLYITKQKLYQMS